MVHPGGFRSGASELYCLSEFNGLRPGTDVHKAYAAGKYEVMSFTPAEDII